MGFMKGLKFRQTLNSSKPEEETQLLKDDGYATESESEAEQSSTTEEEVTNNSEENNASEIPVNNYWTTVKDFSLLDFLVSSCNRVSDKYVELEENYFSDDLKEDVLLTVAEVVEMSCNPKALRTQAAALHHDSFDDATTQTSGTSEDDENLDKALIHTPSEENKNSEKDTSIEERENSDEAMAQSTSEEDENLGLEITLQDSNTDDASTNSTSLNELLNNSTSAPKTTNRDFSDEGHGTNTADVDDSTFAEEIPEVVVEKSQEVMIQQKSTEKKKKKKVMARFARKVLF